MKLAQPSTAAAKTIATKYPTVGNPSEFVARSLVDVEDAVLDVVDAVLDAVELDVAVDDDDESVLLAVVLADVEVLLVDAEAVVEVASVLVDVEASLVDVAEVADVDDSVAVKLVSVVSARACSCLNSMGADLGPRSCSHHSATHVASSSASSLVQPA